MKDKLTIKTPFTAFGLLRKIREYNTAADLLESYDDPYKKGFVYEKLWDIVVKFGLVFGDSVIHYDCDLRDIPCLETYMKKTKVFNGGRHIIIMKRGNTMIFGATKYYNRVNYSKIIANIVSEKKYVDYAICELVYNKKNAMHEYNGMKKINAMDIGDLERYYAILKTIDMKVIYANSRKPFLQMRFHQKMIVEKTMEKIIEGNDRDFLWGWKCRAGKTYGVGGLISTFIETRGNSNILIITPAPTETLPQFSSDMLLKYRNFANQKIIEIHGKKDLLNILLSDISSNIIIASKQLLNNYVNASKVNELHNIDLIVFDENHHGGTTTKSGNILTTYSNENTVRLYLTATYQKPLIEWNIRRDCQFYWDIEDEQLCKNRDIATLCKKHNYENMTISYGELVELKQYDKMPDLHMITTLMDADRYEDIRKRISDDSKTGFSMTTLFSLNCFESEFNYPDEVADVLRYISGSYCDMPEKSIYGRIKKISADNGSRTTLQNSEFTSQLWFLPFGKEMPIDKVSECLLSKMRRDDVLSKFDIMIINSKKKYKLQDLKAEICHREIMAKGRGYNGLILLAGNQCSLGITLPLVDIVMLLNNTTSSDKIMQMMYRSMSETNDGSKKIGYVVDLNMSRVLQTALECKMSSDTSGCVQLPCDEIKNMIENGLINIDADYYDSKENKTKLVEKLLEIWRADSDNHCTNITKRIERHVISLENEDQHLLNRCFTKRKNEGSAVKIKFDEDVDQVIPTNEKGDDIDMTDKTGFIEEEDKIEEIEETITLSKDVLPYVVPFCCIVTMNDETVDIGEMLDMIKGDEEQLAAFDSQSLIWWNKDGLIDVIATVIKKYVKKNSDVYNITVQLKMTVKSLINRKRNLLEFIDETLKPKNVEKRKFGEVFTPLWLIDEMLDDLDKHHRSANRNRSIFAEKEYKWFDPAAGTGNYLISVYMRLMEGLKRTMPDEARRKKHIIENMLYAAELNKKNVLIFKRIFNSKKYAMNIYAGDSLKLDTGKTFGVTEFDVILGNPPYNEELTQAGAKPLYNRFIEKYIDQCKYMTFIVPSRWFSGSKSLNKFRSMMLQRKDLVYMRHFKDASKIFGKKVDIKGGVNYFLKDADYHGKCRFNGTFMDLGKYNAVVKPKYYSLIDTLSKYDNINELYCSTSYYGITTNDRRLVDRKINDDYVKCYVSQQKGFEKYIHKKHIKNDYDFWKVITTYGAHKASSGFGNIYIADKKSVHSGSYISFKCGTQTEAKSLMSYMKCKMPNLMLSLRKNSQHVNADACKWIPLPPLDRIWTNKAVHKYYKLSAADIAIIEKADIVGFKQ